MSSDQRPGKIKIVQATPVSRGGPTDVGLAGSAVGAAQANASAIPQHANPSRGSFVLSALVFLTGCCLGGVALIAWPHFAG